MEVSRSSLSLVAKMKTMWGPSEKFFSPRTQSESAFKPYFQEPSSTSRLLVGEIKPCYNNLDVGRKEAQDEEDC